MAPRGNWGASAPQAKPKPMPKPHASAPSGPAVGPASGGDARNSAAGGGDARHPVVRAPQGVWSDPRAASTPSSTPRTIAAEPTPLEAQKMPSAGMFDAIPMLGAVLRPIGTLNERPPVGMFGERAPDGVTDGATAPISSYEVAYGTPAPLTTAAGPVLGPPPGAAAPVHQEPTAALGPMPTPAASVRDVGWPGEGPGAFVDRWAHSPTAAAHDAPAPGPGAAAPAAAALPGDVALEHGNRLSNRKQGGAVRFGSIDQLGGDDESWGDWSSGPVLCGFPPTEWDDGYGCSDAATAGWGPAAPTGTSDGRLDGDGPPQAAWYGIEGSGVGGPSYSAPGRLTWKTQPARRASAAYRRSPSGDVRMTDVQRTNTVPERWVAMEPLHAGAVASGTGDGVRAALCSTYPCPPRPRP